jgi:hypothetical protein
LFSTGIAHLDPIEIRTEEIGVGLEWELYIQPIVVDMAGRDREIWNEGSEKE